MSQLYNSTAEGFLTGSLDWTAMNVACVLVDATYIFDADHNFLDSVLAGSRRSAFAWMSDPSATDGYAGGDFMRFTSVDATTADVVGIVMFDDTGDAATSRLLAFYDDAPGFPLTVDDDYLVAPGLANDGYFKI